MKRVDCETTREALSARADGEATGNDITVAETHLAQCPSCRSFAADLEHVDRMVRIRPAEPVPDLVAAVTARARPARLGRGGWLRPALAWVAIVMLIQSLPALLLGEASRNEPAPRPPSRCIRCRARGRLRLRRLEATPGVRAPAVHRSAGGHDLGEHRRRHRHRLAYSTRRADPRDRTGRPGPAVDGGRLAGVEPSALRRTAACAATRSAPVAPSTSRTTPGRQRSRRRRRRPPHSL
jgi:hypothetical protein